MNKRFAIGMAVIIVFFVWLGLLGFLPATSSSRQDANAIPGQVHAAALTIAAQLERAKSPTRVATPDSIAKTAHQLARKYWQQWSHGPKSPGPAGDDR